jgi:hypothetical protein
MIFFATLFAAGLLALGEPAPTPGTSQRDHGYAAGGALPESHSRHELTGATQPGR